MNYNHNLIEKKWINLWSEQQTYKFVDDLSKPKFYVLDMFPYPSGKGLHVGHIKGYTATDIISRYKRACGYSVVHPIGYDAFGLPAEQFAIKTNEHPSSFTDQNINNFRRQLKMMGFDHHPNLEINTTDPEYYKWTQWIFNELYKKGLAEIDNIEVNWCEQLGTVLANEEVLIDSEGNKISERGSYPVTKRVMRQWVLKITKYADKLLDGLTQINWTDSIKKMQQDWIGKSTGALVDFNVENTDIKLTVFTTRPDTLFGVTFLALAPENDALRSIVNDSCKDKINEYLTKVKNKSEIDRKDKNNKNGMFIGTYAINPVNGKKIPIWVADYVLNNYATGVVMGTPAHDARDYQFAKIHGLDIIQVIDNKERTIKVDKEPYLLDGIHINSDFLNNLNNKEAIEKIINYIEKNKFGKKATTYKLRDWIFSRQRYWGEPFPILFNDKNEIFLVEDLPVVLPPMDSFAPNADGLPPLANATKWVNVVINNKLYKREVNTMPQWAGSCWYYLAYLMRISTTLDNEKYLPLNSEKAKKIFDRFLPVDIYVGGQEHAVLHLLYARFWHHFLYDIGIVSTPEPFMKLINQGMILNSDGTKMSKSKGSLVNPDDVCNSHGADALRLYEMFMGPITASLAWNESGLDGARKWIERVWTLFHKVQIDKDAIESDNKDLQCAYHEFVEQAIGHLDKQEFNLLISKLMVFINHCYKVNKIPKSYLEGFNIILGFICPFVSEELNEFLGNKTSISKLKMPTFDAKFTTKNTVTISCMINGKFRGSLEFNVDEIKENVHNQFINDSKISFYLQNKNIKKVIFIPNKTISFVVE